MNAHNAPPEHPSEPNLIAESVRIYVTFDGYVEMHPDEVWPDGDVPDEITAEAVKAVMERCGSKANTLDDWQLLYNLEVHVSVGVGDSIEVWPRNQRAALTDGDACGNDPHITS